MIESKARHVLNRAEEGDFAAAVRQVLKEYRRGRLLTIQQVADLANISVRSLQRRLKAERVDFRELVEQVRAELATELLKNVQRTSQEVAHELGYSSSSNFSRAFVRWTGTTPADFRKRRLWE